MKSMDSYERRLASLSGGNHDHVDPATEAWLTALSPGEISRAASLITRVTQGRGDLTHDEAAYLNDLYERPFTTLPATRRDQPRCHICEAQPAIKDGTFAFCKRCHDAMSGEDVSVG
jgi:hypothetical protein